MEYPYQVAFSCGAVSGISWFYLAAQMQHTHGTWIGWLVGISGGINFKYIRNGRITNYLGLIGPYETSLI